jgi:hypothetical protein
LKRIASLFFGIAACSFTAAQAAEQTPDGDNPAEFEAENIVVRARGQSFQTRSDIEPELTLNESDVAAYGVSTLGELIGELLPETTSGRGRGGGRPVVLLNGRRVSGFREIGRYPAEAIARVDVLPEEVSLSYGFSADQRVINVVLKPDVKVTAIQAELDASEEGGTTTIEASGQRLFVDGNTRLSFDGEVNLRSALFEAERDIAFSEETNAADLRTLLSDRDIWEAGFSAGTQIWGESVGTMSGAFERTDSDAQIGENLAAPGTALAQSTRSDDITLGLSLLSGLGPTTWTLTANLNSVNTATSTQFNSGAGQNTGVDLRETTSRNTAADIDAVINARLADLDAGPLTLTGQIGYSSVTQRAGVTQLGTQVDSRLKRDTLTARTSLDIPLTLPKPLPGSMILNGNAQLQDLSDFGTLITYGYGLTWRPIPTLRVIASTTREEGAPSLSEIGAPTIITPQVRIFDFAAGENVFAQSITGGNPDLVADKRRVIKLGVQFQPKPRSPFRFNVDYTRSRITNETRSFLLLTPAFEAAFPGRVLRGDDGALLSFDSRPVLAAQTRRDELRTAINWTKRLKASAPKRPKPPSAAAQGSETKQAGTGAPPNAAAQRGGRRGGRPRGGRIRIAAYHRWILNDDVTVAPGIPAFDFLNGDGTGQTGGTARHEFDVSLRRFKNGIGLSANLNYQTGTQVIDSAGTLRFSSLLQSNLRLSYRLGASAWIARKAPALANTRVVFEGSNLLNDKVQVRDDLGTTPLAFQDDILDPIGRSWRIELRHRF